jgi:hypothetical protein
MRPLGDRKGEEPAAFELGHGLFLQCFVGAHQDREEAEEGDV